MANPVSRSIAVLCSICAAFLPLAACTTAGGTAQAPAVKCSPTQLHVGVVVETATGSLITMDELLDKLSRVSVIYVGETHTSTEDHKIQLELLRKLSRGGRCVELAMEMFPATAQPIIDRYISGGMSEEDFLKEVKWEEIWGFPYSLYRGLIDWQKENHMPVIGLNAPNQIVQKVARNGLDSLSPDERSLLAREFHLDDPTNRERVRKGYSEHEKGRIKDFESFFEAQLAWEETMAQTLAQRLKQTDPSCKIMVAVGKGHINDRLGVPYLTRLRIPYEYATVAPVPIDYPFCTIDPNLADYVVITDKSEPFHRPRLGVTIQSTASGRGVEILGVLPDSPAAAAHLGKGDTIISINGSPVNNLDEVVQAMSKGGPNYKLIVERGKKKITVTVTVGQ